MQSWLRTDGGFGENFLPNEYFKDEYSDNSASKSGEWLTDADIMFYVVKAADAFALYEVNPLARSYGTWSTYELWTHGYGGNGGIEISHLCGYNAAPVPEPATMFLLGMGIVCLNNSAVLKTVAKQVVATGCKAIPYTPMTYNRT